MAYGYHEDQNRKTADDKVLRDKELYITKNIHKNILIYYIGYMANKDYKYVKINSVNFLYFNIDKVNGYFEEINENKYLTLNSTNENKERFKIYEELWSKIRCFIRSGTKRSNDYDERYMEIKFNLDEELPL